MVISHKYKFIFIENGKTGSTSIASSIKKYGDRFKFTKEDRELYNAHIPAIFLKEMVSKDIWDTYFKFAFVRNPWDWFVSQCFFRGEIDIDKSEKLTRKHISDMQKAFKISRRGIYWDDIVYQSSRVMDREGNMMVDFIGKYENLQDDFNKICDKIGIPPEKLPHRKKTNHKSYHHYYTEETKNIIRKLYKRDIDNFSYKY